jgi:hypothetical protein
MAEQFIDTVAEHITGAMEQEIAEDLYDNWSNNNLEEGSEYAEQAFMSYASDDLKKQYNEYYGYTYDDEYYLVLSTEWDLYVAHKNKDKE